MIEILTKSKKLLLFCFILISFCSIVFSLTTTDYLLNGNALTSATGAYSTSTHCQSGDTCAWIVGNQALLGAYSSGAFSGGSATWTFNVTVPLSQIQSAVLIINWPAVYGKGLHSVGSTTTSTIQVGSTTIASPLTSASISCGNTDRYAFACGTYGTSYTVPVSAITSSTTATITVPAATLWDVGSINLAITYGTSDTNAKVKIVNGKLKVDNVDFLIKGMDYAPWLNTTGPDSTQWQAAFPSEYADVTSLVSAGNGFKVVTDYSGDGKIQAWEVITYDMEQMKQMGVNTVRIYSSGGWHDKDLDGVIDTSTNVNISEIVQGDVSDWMINRMLAYAQANNMKVIIGYWVQEEDFKQTPFVCNFDDLVVAKQAFGRVVNAYKSNPAVLGWAIGNEVQGSFNMGWFSWEVDIPTYLNQFYAYVRTLDSNHPIIYSKYNGEYANFNNLTADIIAVNAFTHSAQQMVSDGEFSLAAPQGKAYMLGEYGHIITQAQDQWTLAQQYAGGMFLEYNDVWWKGNADWFGTVTEIRQKRPERLTTLNTLFGGIYCKTDAECNDNNSSTTDTCANPNTTLSACVNTTTQAADLALLDSTQAKAAKYFYEQSISNGFVKDTSVKTFSSIAGTGFGLAALTVMAQRYGTTTEWSYTPTQLRARANLILDNILTIQNSQSANPSTYGTHGLLYHFVNADNTLASGSEVSTVDNAILLAGVITAGEYFGSEVKTKANTILGNTDWNFFLKSPSNNFTSNNGINYQFTHGWYPSSGIISQTWDRPTDEAMLISVIALATNPNNMDYKKSLFSWPRTVRSYSGYSLVNSYFGSLFSYEFAHLFVDFQKIGSDNPTGIMSGVNAVDWWQNSIYAAKANRQFCIDNSSTYSSYGADSWGLSAVEKPDTSYFGTNGALPTDSGFAIHDGTVAPYSAISTMPFFKSEDGGLLMNNLGFRVLKNLYNTRFAGLWGTYGPYDSFNASNQYSTHYSGIDQGPIVLAIENYRTGGVNTQFMNNDSIKAALKTVFTCSGGVCDTSVTCSFNNQCNDNNSLTNDTCVNPATTSSYCQYTPTIVCSLDNQCNDYNSLTTDTCANPGTTSSYCKFTPNGTSCVIPTSGMQITTSTNFCASSYAVTDINIAADNVTLDCKGATISVGSGTIFKISGRNNITIKNCKASGANYIVQISKSNLITFIDNNFLGSWDVGIYAIDSNKLNIKNNKITGNQYQSGVYFYNVNDSNVENNDLSYNGTAGSPWAHAGGIAMWYSNRNRVLNNNMSNGYHGIYVYSSSSYNYFSGNKMCNTSLDSYCGSGLVGNTATGNTLPGGISSSCSWLGTSSLVCDQNCADSDGGSIYLKGTVTFWDGINSGQVTDNCRDANYVNENSCINLHVSTSAQYCAYGCLNGACQTPTCSTNTQCDDTNSLTTDTCVNPGTMSSYCTHTPLTITCSTNAQCGTNNWIGSNYCNTNNIWNTWRTFTCTNPGTVSSACISADANQLKTSCLISQICSAGACVTPACFGDANCNDSNSLTIDTCLNPGTISSSCQHTQAVIACSTDFQCNDSNSLTTDACINPGTISSICTHTALTNGLVFYDSFNSASTVSLNGGQYTFTSGAKTTVPTYSVFEPAVSGNGLHFKSGEFIQYQLLGISRLQQGTVEVLFKRPSTTSGNGLFEIDGNYPVYSNTTQRGDEYYMGFATGYNTFYSEMGSVGQSTMGLKIASNTWHHAAITWNCGTAKDGIYRVYLDGVQGYYQAWTNCKDKNFLAPLLLRIGNSFWYGSMEATVDDLKVYNYPKTALEISADFNSYSLPSIECTAVTDCDSGSFCVNSKCVTPACSTNAQCGTDGNISNVFCSGSNVTQTYRTYTCNSPGTINASCSSVDTNTIIQTCSKYCSAGTCIDSKPTADFVYFRPSNSTWYIAYSAGGTKTQAYGGAGDKPAPADYDGDKKADFAVYRPSNANWIITYSGGGSKTKAFGIPTDTPIPADYDGDGKADIALFRSSNVTWYILKSTTGITTATPYGLSTDKPAPADYDGDGKADIAVYRPSNSNWYISYAAGGGKTVAFGGSTDIPVPRDYDGDGKADIAIYRPSIGTWYILNSSNGQTQAIVYGTATDIPVPADFDGKGPLTNPVCVVDSNCNDGNTMTADTCVNPGTIFSTCTHTTITCNTNAQCGTNGLTGGQFCSGNSIAQSYRTFTCNNPGTTNATCSSNDTPQIQSTCASPLLCNNAQCVKALPVETPLWTLAPTSGGALFRSTTCNTVSKTTCPSEMGWEGNVVYYAFSLPANANLADKLYLKFNVINKNYGGTKDVQLQVSAGSNTSALGLVGTTPITTLGINTIAINSSLFKKGAVNYIKLYGTNITPTGYGYNPPNFKIDSIGLYNGNTNSVLNLAAGDIDKDGVADFVTQDYSGNITIKLMNSDGTVKSSNYTANAGAWWIRGMGDVDKDGSADLFFQNPAGGSVAMWFLDSTGAMKSSLIIGDASFWQVRAIGDVNKDGIADVFFQDASGNVALWNLNSSGKAVAWNGTVGTASFWQVKAAGDINKDGIADLIFQEPGGKVALWNLNSKGNPVAWNGSVGNAAGWTVKAAADIDKDGVADLIFVNPNGTIAIWFMNSNGTMKSAKVVS